MNPTPETTELDARRIRQDFPILRRKMQSGRELVYLDNAATTQKPEEVLQALDDYYRNHNANVHRGLHELSMEASEMYEAAHDTVASFIGAQGRQEVVFTSGTTDSINLVAYSYAMRELKPGDEVVGTVLEHHSNFVPWQQVCREKGAHYRHIPITDEGRIDLEAAKELIGPRTRLLAVSGMSNVLGTVVPVRQLAELAHEHNALVLVDAAQLVPHRAVDVNRLDADLVAFSGHKMLGPTGIGVLYGREAILQRLHPYRYGGEMIKRVTMEDSTWNDLPWKFEAGTPFIAQGVGLAAAVKYLQRVGMDNVQAHEESLTRHALKRLAEIDGLTVYGPPTADDRGGVVSFTLPDAHAHDVSDLLDRQGIAVRAGHHCAQPLAQLLGVPSTTRASFYIYNTHQEVDRLAEGLDRVREVLAKGPGAAP